MTEHVISGCGPGLSRAADTPQEGVRSVLQRPSRAERVLAIKECAVRVNWLMRANEVDYAEVRREFQRGADMCARLGE